jgi:predicted RNA binding protein YcfA (HicA-like mRNA interferase family)
MAKSYYKTRDVRKALTQVGCKLVRISGSHEIWATDKGVPLPPILNRCETQRWFVRTILRKLQEIGILSSGTREQDFILA